MDRRREQTHHRAGPWANVPPSPWCSPEPADNHRRESPAQRFVEIWERQLCKADHADTRSTSQRARSICSSQSLVCQTDKMLPTTALKAATPPPTRSFMPLKSLKPDIGLTVWIMPGP